MPSERKGVGSGRSELCTHGTIASSAPAGSAGSAVSSVRRSSARSSMRRTVAGIGHLAFQALLDGVYSPSDANVHGVYGGSG